MCELIFIRFENMRFKLFENIIFYGLKAQKKPNSLIKMN